VKAKRPKTPEELELERKSEELRTVENQLAERELELHTFRAGLMTFERRYLSVVGVKYAELDNLEAQMYEAVAKLNPMDEEAVQQAAESRAQAEETQKQVKGAEETEEAAAEKKELSKRKKEEKIKLSEEIRQLYRTIAKSCHPDLADDDDERARRHTFMIRVNQAYEKSDHATLRTLWNEWEASPEYVRGEGVALDLIRAIRRISRGQSRITEIGRELQELAKSELNQLRMKAEAGEKIGRDVIAEVGKKLDDQIKEAKARLEEVLEQASE
jgi:hypothetical protein